MMWAQLEGCPHARLPLYWITENGQTTAFVRFLIDGPSGPFDRITVWSEELGGMKLGETDCESTTFATKGSLATTLTLHGHPHYPTRAERLAKIDADMSDLRKLRAMLKGQP